MRLTVLGIDPAFSNMGFCVATVDVRPNLAGCSVSIHELKLVSTEVRDKKEVRKSSDDLRRAQELHQHLQAICKHPKQPVIAFTEVPHGSQSARASWSLGIAVGVLSSCPLPTIQVSALEVKLASVGKKNASKEEMIKWATAFFPHASWIKHAGRITQANEHLADAVATIYAGVRTDEFKRLLAAMTPYGIPKPAPKPRTKLL